METQVLSRKPYPTDVSDDEWAFVAPYLSADAEDAPQRRHDLREVFNALRWIVRTGAPWRYLPGDLPPWDAVYQQTQRWLAAGCFEAMVHDLRELLRWAAGRNAQPDGRHFRQRTRQSTPESGHRAGYDGHKRRKGSKIHLAVDTLGELLALLVTPANAQDRDQVEALAAAVQEATGQHGGTGLRRPGLHRGAAGRRGRGARHPAGGRSSCRRPSAASCCCRGAGWWSAPLPGPAASGAWPKITNACQKRSRACISWPLPA